MTDLPPLNLAHLNVLEVPPPEVVTLADQAGFDSFGLRLSPVREGEVAPPVFGDTPMKRDLVKRLRDSRASLFEIEVMWLRAGTRLEDYRPFLEIGAELGAQHVIAISDLTDHAQAVDMYAHACQLSAEHGLTLGLEFLPWIAVGTLEKVLAIVNAADQPNGHVILDSLHISRTGGDYRTALTVDRSLLRYVQISDAPLPAPTSFEAIAEEAKFNRLPPGEGDLPLVDFCAALPPTMPISVEVAFAAAKGLSPAERAGIAYRSTRTVIETARARTASAA